MELSLSFAGVVRTADINKRWYNWGEAIVE